MVKDIGTVVAPGMAGSGEEGLIEGGGNFLIMQMPHTLIGI